MNKDISICWFRQDLRLSDNPALTKSIENGLTLPIYILDDQNSDKYFMGEASRCWLYHSLKSLNKSLENKLSVYKGDAFNILNQLVDRFNVKAVYWNRCYEPWRIARDTKIKSHLKKKDIEVYTFNGSLLWEPWEIKKDNDSEYKVFTPFYHRCLLNQLHLRTPLLEPKSTNYIYDENQIGVDNLDLLPKIGWHNSMVSHWNIGENGARRQFNHFIEGALQGYQDGRDFPAKPCISRLSPYLHFGEISPNQLWYTLKNLGDSKDIEYFCRELVWREFSYNQLYYNPQLPNQNLNSKFNYFPWKNNPDSLLAWQKGQTGIPIVDAGMRELWQTGFMHNRVRMLVASFLVKNLCIHWHYGASWFWNTLVDADLANNSASWQWVAGSGADAAPYFRIFNPVLQSQKFDSEGKYIRKFIPELTHLPNKYLFSPWEAKTSILNSAGITLGDTYPRPIIDLKQSRTQALDAFKSIKNL